jgi:hypothetical protein
MLAPSNKSFLDTRLQNTFKVYQYTIARSFSQPCTLRHYNEEDYDEYEEDDADTIPVDDE